MIDFLSRQSSALGAHVPQKRSGTLRCRMLSASEGPARSTEASVMKARMVLFSALVSRFRSSQTFAAPSDANFGIKGTLATL